MALKSKGFFLNLEEGTSTDQAIQMAPVRDLPVEDSEEEILAPIPARKWFGLAAAGITQLLSLGSGGLSALLLLRPHDQWGVTQ